jgi:hypothetical protein
MSLPDVRLNLPERISQEKRSAIAARVITLWTMADIGVYLENSGIVFPHKSPNSSAKIVIDLAASSEYRKLRISCLEVEPDSNAHIARHQMGFTSKTIRDKFGNKIVTTSRDLQIATYYLEDNDIADKINSSTGITEVLIKDGRSFRNHFTAQAIEQIDAFEDSVDLRGIVSRTTQESQYWLNH